MERKQAKALKENQSKILLIFRSLYLHCSFKVWSLISRHLLIRSFKGTIETSFCSETFQLSRFPLPLSLLCASQQS